MQNWNFQMTVHDVFTITGRGTVATGRISQGEIRVGDEITIMRTGARTVVGGIEKFRSIQEVASAGEDVGILLKDIKRDEISAGDMLVNNSELGEKIPLYKVVLENSGANIEGIIQEVLAFTGAGLKEARDAVAHAPSLIATNLTETAAEEFKRKVEQIGGRIEIYEQDRPAMYSHTLEINKKIVKKSGCLFGLLMRL